MLFAPFIAFRKPVTEHLKNNKGLAVMGAYTLTFVLMMICIGFSVGPKAFFPLAFSIAAPLVSMAWGIFASVRYLKGNALVKTGASIASVGVCSWLLDVLVGSFGAKASSLTGVTYSSTSGFAVGVTFIGIAALLIILGIIIGLAKGGNKNA